MILRRRFPHTTMDACRPPTEDHLHRPPATAHNRERLGSGWPLIGRRGARFGGGRHRHQPGETADLDPTAPPEVVALRAADTRAGHLRPWPVGALLQLPAMPDVPGGGEVGPGGPGGSFGVVRRRRRPPRFGQHPAVVRPCGARWNRPAPLVGVHVPDGHRSPENQVYLTPTASSTDTTGTERSTGPRREDRGIQASGAQSAGHHHPRPAPHPVSHVALVCPRHGGDRGVLCERAGASRWSRRSTSRRAAASTSSSTSAAGDSIAFFGSPRRPTGAPA